MSDVVRVERSGAHALVTIDHPKANAISAAVVGGLRAAVAALAADDAVRALVITGSGTRFFAAGADVKEFPAAAVAGRPAAGGAELMEELEALPKPVIAAVNGLALGGGCELAMACDIRLAARSARFGQPEINLGIIPGWGGTQRLPRLVGRGRALSLLLSGEMIDAATALSWGLVSEVVDDVDLPDAAAALAERLASKPPRAVAAIKAALRLGVDRPLAEGLAAEQREFLGVFTTADAREGIAAFLEGRQPAWTGR